MLKPLTEEVVQEPEPQAWKDLVAYAYTTTDGPLTIQQITEHYLAMRKKCASAVAANRAEFEGHKLTAADANALRDIVKKLEGALKSADEAFRMISDGPILSAGSQNTIVKNARARLATTLANAVKSRIK